MQISNTRHLSASEIQHYASLGLLPDSTLAERLPDIADAIYSEASDDAEKAASASYDDGAKDGASGEKQDAARIMKRLRNALLASTFERENFDVEDAMRAALDYIEESGIR